MHLLTNPVEQFALLLVILYLAPTLIALLGHKRNWLAIAALNVFGGWTGIGYMTALTWALVKD